MAGVFTARSPDAWTGARAPTRASKAEEEGGKALKGAEHQREGTRAAGAARFTSHESRQHRAAASARARQVTVLPEVGACRSGAPQHETTRHQHIK